LPLAVEWLCWVDAGNNGGLVQRYEVFQLPSLFLVRDGQFLGAVQSSLSADGLNRAIQHALQLESEELP
ncbi:MAG TPA: hypothetical protein VJN01_13060, partial [Xanthomonadales bacterium]|nr:hypothetical protein [Xanthomonadales bacterium]